MSAHQAPEETAAIDQVLVGRVREYRDIPSLKDFQAIVGVGWTEFVRAAFRALVVPLAFVVAYPPLPFE